jgi:hypothetical protein
MDGLAMLATAGAVIGAVVGATWALRTKLGDIEIAIRGHIIEDKAVQGDHEKRIVKLEGRRAKR